MAKIKTLEEVEIDHILTALATCESIQETAEALGIDATTLYRKRKRYKTQLDKVAVEMRKEELKRQYGYESMDSTINWFKD